MNDLQELRRFNPATRQFSEMLIADVQKLSYQTNEITSVPTMRYDDEGHLTSQAYEGDTYTESAYADCYSYSSRAGWYGLMSRDGKIITPPIYDSNSPVQKVNMACARL